MAIVIRQHVSLKEYNTLAIDAETRFFATIDSMKCLEYVLLFAKQKRLPRLILGAGSNIVIGSDFPGITMQIDLRGIDVLVDTECFQVLEISAGENWENIVKHCVENKLYGIENLSLIPGNIGAAPIQNIGAYGVELQDVLVWVKVWNIETGREERLTVDECELGYRDSIFKGHLKDKVIITSVTLKLSKQPQVSIGYKDLQEYFDLVCDGQAGEQGDQPETDDLTKDEFDRMMRVQAITPEDVREAVIAIRMQKLPDTRLAPNVGSFFKNPIVSEQQFEQLQADFPDIPSFPLGTNQIKLSAAWFIDKAGWCGYHSDQVAVHEGQPLVLINLGEATGESILVLAGRVRSSVMRQFDVMLEVEPQIV